MIVLNSNKKIFCLCLVFFAVYFHKTSVTYAEGFIPVPQLEAPTTIYNFGSIREGTIVEHRFTIENKGVAPLKIEKVHSACGCTAAVVDSDIIPPNDKTAIKVSFDTTGFQGNKIKTVRIYTNDPRQSSVIFSMQGKIESDFEMNLSKVSFGEVFKGQSKELRFRVNSNSTYKITDANTRSQYIEVSLSSPESQPKSALIIVKLRDNLPIGIFHERVALKTESPLNPIINVPVEAKIIGDLQPDLDSISFGLIEKSAPYVEEKLLIKNNSHKRISITDIKSDNPNITAEIINKGSDGSFLLAIRLNTASNGSIKNILKISTDNPDIQQQILEIPIYGIINKKNS